MAGYIAVLSFSNFEREGGYRLAEPEKCHVTHCKRHGKQRHITHTHNNLFLTNSLLHDGFQPHLFHHKEPWPRRHRAFTEFEFFLRSVPSASKPF